TEGKKTVTVTYKGKTATFDVNVTKTPVIAVDSIAIATAPTKTTYKVGEELDVTGGTITVTYTGGKEAETIDITAAMCTGFDSTTEGTKTVTVTYEGKTATFEVTVKNSNIDNEGTVIEVGTGKECADLTAALAKINAAVKARSADTAYTLVLTDKAYSEKKALAFPALKVIIKGDEGTEITVPSVTAKGDLALENLTLKTAKGANAAVTAKKALTAYNCTLGKTAVTGDALLDNCTTGALTAKANLTITGGTYELITASGKAGTKTTLNDAVTVTKNLTVSNDLVIVGNSTVGGKFTAKAGLNINGFTVKNGK
ncbi:MAG: bacterial Ig-like domain-containing protein, partial [Ruminiclostridium sp.]|nr:bacterial Ig-like domain-containing protein [Ruminiclostridium sp.]